MIDEDAFAAVARRTIPGGRLRRVWPLTGGVSAIMHALEIEGSDGVTRRTVVRRRRETNWKPLTASATSTEFALLERLHKMDFEVPRVCLVDESGEIFPTPYYVMDFVEGTTSVDRSSLPDALEQMAFFLARLHSVDLKGSRLPTLPELEDPIAGTLEYLPKEAHDELRAHLSGSPPWTAPTRSLLHGDFWPGNILWRDARIAAVLDWEDATFGDPLSDLAAARVELLCQYDMTAMERFTQHYVDSTSLDLKTLAVWEVYVSAAALATMGEWGLDAKAEAKRRSRTQSFLEQAVRGILETK